MQVVAYNAVVITSEAESMPIHNGSQVPAGLFHHFHQRWAVAICDA